MKKYKIYCLKNPDTMEIRYIGVTTAKYISSRLSQHYYSANHNFQTHVAKWIRKIGKKPIIELIEICNENNWEKREKYWIKKYNNLTNIHEGGKGVVINRNKTSIERSAQAKCIKIVQLDNNGNLLNIFNSIKEASKHIKAKSHSSISNVLNNNYGAKTAFGFQWFYYNDYINNNYKLRIKDSTVNYSRLDKVYLYDLNFKLIKKFKCLYHLSKYINCYSSSALKALNRKTPIYNKYYIRNYKI